MGKDRNLSQTDDFLKYNILFFNSFPETMIFALFSSFWNPLDRTPVIEDVYTTSWPLSFFFKKLHSSLLLMLYKSTQLRC